MRGLTLGVLFSSLLIVSGARADDNKPSSQAPPDLVKQANAPISSILQLRLQNSYYPEFTHVNGDGNAFVMGVTMPLPKYRLLPLAQLSLLTIPAAITPPGGPTGFGDLRLVNIAVINVGDNVLWGVGPVLVFPTASERTIGQGKWQAGPAAAVAFFPKKWLFGFLAQNPLSFAGDDDRPDASSLILQPFVSYQFGKGWFVRSQPPLFFNWETRKQILPVDLGIGRVFKIGRRHVSCFVQPFWNAVHDEPAPEYGITFGISLLYPDVWGS